MRFPSIVVSDGGWRAQVMCAGYTISLSLTLAILMQDVVCRGSEADWITAPVRIASTRDVHD